MGGSTLHSPFWIAAENAPPSTRAESHFAATFATPCLRFISRNGERKTQTLETLEEGKVLTGTVKNITEYGAFVDLGGIDGLLHISDMSWGRINHPSEVINVGDELRVVVLKFDRDTERVSLGMKQLLADPWTTATIKYPVAARVKGKVVSLTDYGAFVELEQGVEGLIHVSEMSWSKKVKHPSKILTVGDWVECVVLELDQEARRLSLGLKQTEPNPWELIDTKYRVGDTTRRGGDQVELGFRNSVLVD